MWQRRNKYGNKRTVVDGISFHSKKEAGRYSVLKHLHGMGQIKELRLQPRYPLTFNGQKIGTYVGDFEYVDHNGKLICEDVKGMPTDIYKWKRKHFVLEYPHIQHVES